MTGTTTRPAASRGARTLRGLSADEVACSRAEHGENRLSERKTRGFFSRFAANLGDPVIKVLLCALAANIIFTFRHTDWFETIGIAVSVLTATIVSTVSEYGGEAAYRRLSAEAGRAVCRVRRAGLVTEIPGRRCRCRRCRASRRGRIRACRRLYRCGHGKARSVRDDRREPRGRKAPCRAHGGRRDRTGARPGVAFVCAARLPCAVGRGRNDRYRRGGCDISRRHFWRGTGGNARKPAEGAPLAPCGADKPPRLCRCSDRRRGVSFQCLCARQRFYRQRDTHEAGGYALSLSKAHRGAYARADRRRGRGARGTSHDDSSSAFGKHPPHGKGGRARAQAGGDRSGGQHEHPLYRQDRARLPRGACRWEGS